MFFRETEFKETPVGKVPEVWHIVELNQVSDIKRGPFGGSIKKEIFVPKGFKVYEQKNVIHNNFNLGSYYIDENKFSEMKSFAIKEGDILLTGAGTIGKIAIVPECFEPGIINQALIKITLDNNKILVQYFHHLFNYEPYREMVLGSSHGATMKNISSIKNLGSLKIPLPPIKEQHGIVEVLSCVDLAIQNTSEVIAKTERLKKGLMQQLLTKGIGHKEFKDTPIGKTPKTWQVEKLGNVATYEKGKAPKALLSNPTRNTLPYLNAESLRTGSFTQWGEVTKEVVEVHEDDALLIWDGFYCGDAFIGYEGILSSTMIKIGTNENHLNKRFLFYILKTHFKELNTKISGMYLKHVNKHVFESIKIPIPPISEQQSIVEMLSHVDKKLELERTEKTKLERIKLGLMDLLLTGKIRVKVD